MQFRYLNIKNSLAAVYVLGLALVLYILIWARAEWPAGGEDSWNHYLYARWCLKHPQLMLDQWGKPLFTIPAIPFALFGIKGLYLFNIACCLGAGHLCYLTAKRLGTKLPWMAAVFFLFQPIVFGNVISGLTEPVNAIFLAWIFYCFASNRNLQGATLASLLPFFRSEGFVILAAIVLYLIVRRKWKQLPFVLSGSVLYTLIMGIGMGKWGAIIDENPYLRFESQGKFDPGHGDFLHYTSAYKEIWGLVLGLLLVLAFLYLAAHVVYLLRKRTPEERSRYAFWLLAPVFLSFFLAHSYIWWKGSMGSHGLLRVFVVVAPCVALLAQYAFDRILALELRLVNRFLPIALTMLCIYLGYKGNHYRMPWHSDATIAGYPGEANIDKAFALIKERGLEHKVIVHQLPFINAQKGWDPWAGPAEGEKFENWAQTKAQTFYLWSLDKNPGKDWFPDSSVVIWDGFHAVRDAPMPLAEMRKLPEYQELAYFKATDSIYDVRVFLKSKKAR